MPCISKSPICWIAIWMHRTIEANVSCIFRFCDGAISIVHYTIYQTQSTVDSSNVPFRGHFADLSTVYFQNSDAIGKSRNNCVHKYVYLICHLVPLIWVAISFRNLSLRKHYFRGCWTFSNEMVQDSASGWILDRYFSSRYRSYRDGDIEMKWAQYCFLACFGMILGWKYWDEAEPASSRYPISIFHGN